ncbi:unnamed protein product [Hyaloperonospora brassicae]|uniref:FYVE-type domain-containing protein n=1 Tax=Hyaloperonospora brassicae TaxID=162125 RepID=A0AAV0UN45_HYABA|nr:unnamed protein product [Hyaloperonospora brassicae]
MLTKVTTPSLLQTRSRDPLESSWRQHMGHGQWVPDVSVDTCMLCRTAFSFWIRRHHCRRCGAVVCDACSGSRTKFIYKEISPKRQAEEDCRVCDACIQVIDEKVALSVSRRVDKRLAAAALGSPGAASGQQTDAEPATPLAPDAAGNRTVMTTGRYRAEISESEGNRYIRDIDL